MSPLPWQQEDELGEGVSSWQLSAPFCGDSITVLRTHSQNRSWGPGRVAVCVPDTTSDFRRFSQKLELGHCLREHNRRWRSCSIGVVRRFGGPSFSLVSRVQLSTPPWRTAWLVANSLSDLLFWVIPLISQN